MSVGGYLDRRGDELDRLGPGLPSNVLCIALSRGGARSGVPLAARTAAALAGALPVIPAGALSLEPFRALLISG